MSLGLDPTQSQAAATVTAGTNAPSHGFRGLSKLHLTEDQRTQIRSIYKNAASDGTSATDVDSQIEAVLTPEQAAQFQAEQGQAASSGASSATSGTANSALPNIFTGLNLTSAQQTAIASLLDSSESTTVGDVQSQVDGVLTSAQKTELQQEIAAGPSASYASNVPQQIAASNALNNQQLQYQLAGPPVQGRSGHHAGRTHGHGAAASAASTADDSIDTSLSSGTSTSSSTSVSGSTNTASLISNELQGIQSVLAQLESELDDAEQAPPAAIASSNTTAATSSDMNAPIIGS